MNLVVVFVDFVAFVVSDVGSGAGWNADSNVASRVEVLSIFFLFFFFFFLEIYSFKVIMKCNSCAKSSPKLFKEDFYISLTFLYIFMKIP